MSNPPGSIPLRVKCGCPEKWVPVHVSRDLIALLSASQVAADFPIAVAKCRRCRQYVTAYARDLPLIRSAA